MWSQPVYTSIICTELCAPASWLSLTAGGRGACSRNFRSELLLNHQVDGQFYWSACLDGQFYWTEIVDLKTKHHCNTRHVAQYPTLHKCVLLLLFAGTQLVCIDLI